jgi:hypothetical protein
VFWDNLIRGRNGIYVIIDMHAAPGGQTGQNIDDSANDRKRRFAFPPSRDWQIHNSDGDRVCFGQVFGDFHKTVAMTPK